MNDFLVAPTPKAKLAQSRADLLAAMGLEPTVRSIADPVIELPRWTPSPARPPASARRRWWRRHPARSAIELFEPGLARYARRNPHRLIGYAAGAGSLLVLLKPWRLLSLGAAVALAVRATDIAGAALAFLENARAASRAATTKAQEPRRWHSPYRASGTESLVPHPSVHPPTNP